MAWKTKMAWSKATFFIALYLLSCISFEIDQKPAVELTSSLQQTLKLIHDVELNPGPQKFKKTTYCTVTHLNVRSLKSRETFLLVANIITENSYDIFTISESWLDTSINNADINIPGYLMFRQDRGAHKAGGGLVVYVKNIFKVTVMEQTSSVSESDFQQLWLKIQCKNFKSFLLCTVYRPPNSPIGVLANLTKAVMDSLLLGLDIIIMGDMNINMLAESSDRDSLVDLCSTFDFSQLVKEPTRITERSQTLIDVVLTTNENIAQDCKVITSSISDHNLVSLTLKLKTPKPKPCYITSRNYTSYDSNKFAEDLSDVPFHIIEIFDDIDDQVNAFNLLFTQVLDIHAPVKEMKIRSKPNPYITPEIKALMRTRDKWHKSAIRTNDCLHWNAYRFFRQEVKREIRIEEKQHVRCELNNSNGNSNSIWKIINRCLPKERSTLVSAEDPVFQANRFNEYYTSVGQTTAEKAKALAEQHGLNITVSPTEIIPPSFLGNNSFTFKSITEEDTCKIIKSLPSNKAPGIDQISTRALKDSLSVTSSVITTIINNSFYTNSFPLLWKLAKVIPCPKTKDSEEPCDTRPISLLPIISKVLERAAHFQLMTFLEENDIIAEFQSGNRKQHSTETALLYFTDELLKNMDNKNISIIILLDMSKAFDSIRHDILLSKLQRSGISVTSIPWFENYLSNRKQVVQIGNSTSEPRSLAFGVPQGTILSPLLFTLYINDLLSIPKHCKTMGYVDDTKLFLAIPSKEVSEAISALNDDLRAIAQWCCTNSLLINPDKTKVLTVGVPQRLKSLPSLSVTLLGKNIEVIPSTKDLGVTIDKCLESFSYE